MDTLQLRSFSIKKVARQRMIQGCCKVGGKYKIGEGHCTSGGLKTKMRSAENARVGWNRGGNLGCFTEGDTLQLRRSKNKNRLGGEWFQ